MGLLERVQRVLRATDRAELERVHDAIETIADEVDQVSRRLAVIDPEWELMARDEIGADLAALR